MSTLKEAFVEAGPAIEKASGARLAPPKHYQPNQGAPVWIAEIDLGQPGLVAFPAAVELVFLRTANGMHRCSRTRLLEVAGDAARRLAEPMPHVVVAVRDLDPARLLAPEGDPRAGAGPSASKRDAPDATDALIAATDPPFVVKGAAGALAVAALLVSLTGLQILGTDWFNPLADVMQFVLIALGVPGLAIAAYQFRARWWAGIAALVYAALTSLVMIAWTMYVLTTIMSPLMYAATAMILVAGVLAALAIPKISATDAARRKLAEQGLVLGL